MLVPTSPQEQWLVGSLNEVQNELKCYKTYLIIYGSPAFLATLMSHEVVKNACEAVLAHRNYDARRVVVNKIATRMYTRYHSPTRWIQKGNGSLSSYNIPF